MRVNLSVFLSVIDGGEEIRIWNYNTKTTAYTGKKVDCPHIDADVISVWTMGNKIVIEVV